MPSFNQDVANLARKNSFFRQEVVTGSHSQVVLMSIPQGGEIGEETHHDVDQTSTNSRGSVTLPRRYLACEVDVRAPRCAA